MPYHGVMAIVQVVVYNEATYDRYGRADASPVDEFVYFIMGTETDWDTPHDDWGELDPDEEHERVVAGEYDYLARKSGYLDDEDEFECL